MQRARLHQVLYQALAGLLRRFRAEFVTIRCRNTANATAIVQVPARVGSLPVEGQGVAVALMTVLAGSRSEFPLQPGTRNAYVRPARALQPSYTPPGMRQLVRLRTVCR